ncbi:GHMP kinase [Streptomyces indicus]|uniref:GHMP family kinase ATP-binding protein n=1 Tax=Streptomyces indicus TaxID=417292 RepID=UPI000A603A1B|nr:GHMP kinase [Streptomyces indicus]
MRTGTGSAPCHHGELLQGVFLDAEGTRRAGLVTLPLDGQGTRAVFLPGPGTEVEVVPGDRAKALRAAVLTRDLCAQRARVAPCGGQLTLSGDVPVGLGMGSSTSDVIAAVRAVADAFGVALAPDEVARLAVRAEQASDPLMLDDRPRLFAQRDGRVIEELGARLPALVVLGCALSGGRPVDTLALPAPAPDEEQIRVYERLRALLRRAIRTDDRALTGRVCTASARLGQHRLAHPEFATVAALAGHSGAVGVQIAHSGCVAGLLFDPAAPGVRRRLRRCARDLEREGIPVTRTFTTFPVREESFRGRAHSRGDRPAGPGAPRRPAAVPALRDHEGRLRPRRRTPSA